MRRLVSLDVAAPRDTRVAEMIDPWGHIAAVIARDETTQPTVIDGTLGTPRAIVRDGKVWRFTNPRALARIKAQGQRLRPVELCEVFVVCPRCGGEFVATAGAITSAVATGRRGRPARVVLGQTPPRG